VKQLSARWVAVTLLAPVLIVLGFLLIDGLPPEAATSPNNGTVEVAFQSQITTSALSPAALSFQRMLLNVVAVRLNPSTNPDVAEDDSQWQTILVPTGVGSSNTGATITTNFTGGGNLSPTGNAVAVGQGKSEIQLDLNALQNLPQIFNSKAIPPKTYNQIELVLDPAIQGNAIPVCAGTAPAGEGCVVYPAISTSATTPTGTIRTTQQIIVTRKTVQPLVIQINVTFGPPPTSTGSPSKTSVAITPTIQIITDPNQTRLGTVKGKVTNAGAKAQVTAELSGTGQIVATTALQSGGTFTMSLPALPASDGGTNYDLYATGAGTYAVKSRVNLANNETVDLTGQPFTTATTSVANLTGKVVDACSGSALPAATLQLFVPDTSQGVSTCTFNSVGNVSPHCVIVASATTDEGGHFPIPGNATLPAPFSMVPQNPPAGADYMLKITASGYNGLVQQVEKGAGGFVCPASGFAKKACSASLEHGEIDGTVQLAAGTTTLPLNVLVMAEDSNSNNVENLAIATIPASANSANFTILVPDSAATPPSLNPVASFDMFGAVQDQFAGSPQKASGHTIAVTSGVAGSARCPTPAAAPTASLVGFECVGHGSVAGETDTADLNTIVVLSKDNVQLMQTAVAPFDPSNNSNTGNAFSFCAPVDTYQLEHYETVLGGTPVAVPPAQSTTLATPVATSSPGCASICASNPAGNCLICRGIMLLNNLP
jgi:hypothetical protein